MKVSKHADYFNEWCDVQDILTEILSEQSWGVVDWVDVWRCWVSSSLDSGTTLDMVNTNQITRMVKLPSQVTYSTGCQK